ncbi:uncharacterized protein LOC134271309 [Saccostrea cucullata]|uniref:uncharacterized protein LOC134271309 n=1 Tax=Saccostrea cuccullata TaxID=36930 RepID=UPI002ED3A15C
MLAMTEKKFRIPGEDQEHRQPPIHWQLKYDTTHDVRFESMRSPVRHGQLHRIHRDLTKETERKIRAYDRGQRIFTAEVRRYSQKVQNRLATLRNITNSVNTLLSMKYSYNDWKKHDSDARHHFAKTSENARKIDDQKLLFRVSHREGGEKVTTAKTELSRDDLALPEVSTTKTLPPQTMVVHRELTMP